MIDHIGLLPAYIAAVTACLALVADLVAPGRWTLPAIVGAIGAAATGVTAAIVGAGHQRSSFCLSGGGCSYRADALAAMVAVLFAVLTIGALGLAVPVLRDRILPSGEFCFLLACSMTGGVMLGGARDLVFVLVAVETITIPLYALVGLRREARAAEATLTFFITSVVATSVALLGAGLLYAATGTVNISRLGAALAADGRPDGVNALIPVGIVLLLVGLAVKVAAVPVHGWAAPTYDGATLPVAAFLSTASKLGGITSVLIVVSALRTRLDVVGPTLAIIAVLTMTIGNLVALKQRRMVRLLAWSSIAQGGYLLAPLGALAISGAKLSQLIAATLAYTVFFVVLEFGAFASLIAVRGPADGGEINAYRGIARRNWWVGTALVLALTGLAGLPPGVSGLFAKVMVVRALVGAGGTWLAVVVALNAVIGLAYYARLIQVLFSRSQPASASGTEPTTEPDLAAVPVLVGAGSTGAGTATAVAVRPVVKAALLPWSVRPVPVAAAVVAVVAVVTVAGVVMGCAPQLVFDAAKAAAQALP